MGSSTNTRWCCGAAVLLMAATPTVIRGSTVDTARSSYAHSALALQLASWMRNICSPVQLRTVLKFNAEAATWAAATAGITNAHLRLQELNWGMQNTVLPIIAPAFSADPFVRARSLPALARTQGQGKDWIVAHLLRDWNQYVQLSAAAAIQRQRWGPLTTEALLQDALGKSVLRGDYTMELRHLYPVRQWSELPTPVRTMLRQPLLFTVPTMDSIGPYNRGLPRIFSMLLRRGDHRLIAQLLTAPIRRSAIMVAKFGLAVGPLNRLEDPGPLEARRYIRLCASFRPRAAVPYLLFLAQTRKVGGLSDSWISHGISHYQDSLSLPILLLIITAGKNPAGYGFRGGPHSTWVHASSEAAQKRALILIRNYWRNQGLKAWHPGFKPIADLSQADSQSRKFRHFSGMLGPRQLPTLPSAAVSVTLPIAASANSYVGLVVARLQSLVGACLGMSRGNFQRQMNLNAAISSWAAAVSSLPRAKLLDYFARGLSPRIIGAVGAVYSGDMPERVAGVQAIKKVPGAWVDWILSQQLIDDHTTIRWATMDALWPGTPTRVIVGDEFKFLTGAGGLKWTRRKVTIGSRDIILSFLIEPYRSSGFYNDRDFADSELLHWHSPYMNPLLAAYLKGVVDAIARGRRLPINQANDPISPVLNYLMAYQPRGVVPYLLYLIKRPIWVPSRLWNPGFTLKERIDAYHGMPLLILAKATKKPSEFGFHRVHARIIGGKRMRLGPEFWTGVSYKDAPEVVEKMTAWWRRHGVTPWKPGR